jgi:hypothetical protein
LEGQLNILTVAGMVGNILQVECVYDESDPDKKGLLTSSGNLKNVLIISLLCEGASRVLENR